VGGYCFCSVICAFFIYSYKIFLSVFIGILCNGEFITLLYIRDVLFKYMYPGDVPGVEGKNRKVVTM